MKITQLVCQVLRVESVDAKTASCQDVALVRIRTDSGLEGIGEADASPEVVQSVIDAPFSQQFFDIAKRQREPGIEPNRVLDDQRRKAMSL